jgi:nitroreductase
MQLDEAIKTRRSVKKFTGKEADWKKIVQAIDLTRFTPMAGAMCSVKFIIISEKDRIKQIANATQQPFVHDAGNLIIVVSDRTKVDKMFDYNKKGFAQQQAGAAIQNLLLSLTEKKIDHCWVGFFDDELVAKACKIPEGQTIEAIIALGVESKLKISSKRKEKPLLENLVYFEQFGTRKMVPDEKVRHEWS